MKKQRKKFWQPSAMYQCVRTGNGSAGINKD